MLQHFFFFQKEQQNLLLKNKDSAQFLKWVDCGRENRTYKQLWLEESRFWCPLSAQGCPAAVMTRKERVKVQDCPSRLSEPPQGAQLRQKLRPSQVLWGCLWLSCGVHRWAAQGSLTGEGKGWKWQRWLKAFQSRKPTKWEMLPALTAAPKGTQNNLVQMGTLEAS